MEFIIVISGVSLGMLFVWLFILLLEKGYDFIPYIIESITDIIIETKKAYIKTKKAWGEAKGKLKGGL